LTHLHTDHVGWNTLSIGGRWVPTFANATHVFSRAERDFYATPAADSRGIIFEDSVRPVIEAGKAVTIDDQGGPYLDGITFLPTPGHSPGHMSISITSRGEEAIFAGDFAHNPIQVRRPDWNSVFCADPGKAGASRRWLLDYAAQRGATLFTPHFPETSVGTVSRRGDGFEWRYVGAASERGAAAM
jgi:glyoxylase-like metal-dependent hydrolase (beta-lactamase superfamily II)